MEIGLVELLRAAWLAGILPILIASITHFSSYHGAIMGFAKRGKIMQSSSQKFTVPQRFFLHFYIVGVIWTTFLLLVTWFYAYKMVPFGSDSLHFSTVASHLTGGSHIFSMHKSHVTSVEHGYRIWKTVFLLLLMEIQVLRRLYETIRVFNYSPSARMHVLGYFTGHFYRNISIAFPGFYLLAQFVGTADTYCPAAKTCITRICRIPSEPYVSFLIYLMVVGRNSNFVIVLLGDIFYTAAPLSLCSICAPEVFSFAVRQVAEFIVKGRDKMPIVEFDWWGYVQPLTELKWGQWTGAAIFIWGWIHQRRCHAILGSLREHKEQDDKYVIPYGDWFEYVSSPHYLAEIVIYAGILFASGGSDLTIWLLLGFVVANLAFAAAETQRWYVQKFEKYPRTRRAILPFLY